MSSSTSEAPSALCHWIAPAQVRTLRAVVFRARKSFALPQVPGRFVLHIAAESLYQLWVNGIFVGNGPARGTAAVNFYDTYDIARLLRTGSNTIAVQVACDNLPSFVAAPAEPALIVWTTGNHGNTDGTWDLQHATDWHPNPAVYTRQKGLSEQRTLSAEPVGWQQRMDQGTWQPATILQSPALLNKALKPRDIPLLRTIEREGFRLVAAATVPCVPVDCTLPVADRMTDEPHAPLPVQHQTGEPMVIHPPGDGRGVTVIFDAGREIASGFYCDISAPIDTVLDVGYAEAIHNGHLRLNINDRRFADRFILRAGRQQISPINERGYRYLQLTLRNFHAPVTLHNLHGIDRIYPANNQAAFTCSDESLNRIWNACIATMSSCATDTFIDCPWRESALWICDLLVQNVTWLQTYADPRLFARCIRLALTQARPDGWIPIVCPVDAPGDLATIAANLTIPTMIEDYVLHTGDVALAAEVMEPLQKILAAAAKLEDRHGLVPMDRRFWSFIEWSYGNGELDGRSTAVVNWFYVLASQSVGRLLEQLGQPDEARHYHATARAIAQRINRHLWDEMHGCYAEWTAGRQPGPVHTQLSNAAALLTQLVPTHRQQQVMDALHRDDVRPPELFMTHVLQRAMSAANQPAAALARIRRYWQPIVASGSPTIWEMNVHEHGADAFDGAGSVCHAFATTPVDFFQRVLLGVSPVSPGFATFRFDPHPCDLESAAGHIPTPRGLITVNWNRTADGTSACIDIPPHTVAVLADGSRLPAGRHHVHLPAADTSGVPLRMSEMR